MTCVILFAAGVVGASLALSGAALQTVLRNPLAEPYILGLVGGASLGVALAFWAGWAAASPLWIPAMALLGACLSLALVCVVSFFAARTLGCRAFNGGTVILAGFVAGSLTNSFQMLVLSFATPEQSAAAYKWVWGDLQDVRLPAVCVSAIVLVIAFTALYSQSRKLNALVLGEDVARSLGVDVRRTQLIALGAASLATAVSVALAGAVGFLGLVVPHVVRRTLGANHRIYLPASFVCGGVLLVFMQILSSSLLPAAVPLGVVCALVGAPFFLWLLTRRSRA